MAHGKIPRFLRTALQISLLCTISVSQVFARSRTLVVFSVGNNKLARDQVSDCDLYSTLCIPKRQYLYKAQVGPRELPLRGRGSVKFRCGETETPSANSMKYRCWGISREGREGCASRARCRRRDETETSMLRCISDERVCSLYTSSYLSM